MITGRNAQLAFVAGAVAAMKNSKLASPVDFAHAVFYGYRASVETGTIRGTDAASIAYVKGWRTAEDAS